MVTIESSLDTRHVDRSPVEEMPCRVSKLDITRVDDGLDPPADSFVICPTGELVQIYGIENPDFES